MMPVAWRSGRSQPLGEQHGASLFGLHLFKASQKRGAPEKVAQAAQSLGLTIDT